MSPDNPTIFRLSTQKRPSAFIDLQDISALHPAL